MKKTKKKSKPTYPKPLSKKLVTDFASKHHAVRPMIFWEKARVWDWRDLLTDDFGEPDKELLLERLSQLHLYFADDAVTDNKRSMVMIVKVTVPTQRDWLRICEKYGYDSDLMEDESLEAEVSYNE
jgi:hypothetical protein